jgi:hypothetical protein
MLELRGQALGPLHDGAEEILSNSIQEKIHNDQNQTKLRLSFVNLNGGSRRTSMLYHIAKLKT